MWPLQPAEVEVRTLAMTQQIKLKLPATDPILHFSRRLDVLAWLPRRIASLRGRVWKPGGFETRPY
jgi:uncharacterized protein